MSIHTIDIRKIRGFKLGNAQNIQGGTGCTAIICEKGAVAGVDVRGGAPATRETDLLRSENMVEKINSVVLSGGSCFGLEASCGVQKELADMGVGDDYFGIHIPIVCGASLFDLGVAESNAYPDIQMGRNAVKNAYNGIFAHGNCGAGTGASVGKILGMDRAMKTGLGTYACSDDELELGAVVAVNAVADVYDGSNRMIAGLVSEDGMKIEGSIKAFKNMLRVSSSPKASAPVEEAPAVVKEKPVFRSMEPVNIIKAEFDYIEEQKKQIPFNTTIACLITNAKMTKSQCNKLATILHDAYARAIKPVHTTCDGDTIFVMTTDEIEVNFDAFAALATDIMQYSIIDAALSAKSCYGLKAACDFKR